MSARIQKIKETYSEQFQKRLEQEKVDISLDSAWDILVSADPSPNKKNVRWLVETYINNGFLWEDIIGGPTSKVSETLTEFDKHKRNLAISERSLMKYQTLGVLWKAIKPYVGQLTPGEEKREERDKAYSEAEVIVDREDGLKIVVPLTEYSSKWFGRGTRWCTAAENNNLFFSYAKDAPLFIISMPDGDKLQLWMHSSGIQFMDENDVNVSLDYIKANWDILGPVILNTRDIHYIPDDLITYEICKSSMEQYPHHIQNIPERFMTEEICKLVINKNHIIFLRLPEKSKTNEICELMVEIAPHSFTLLDNDKITKQICHIAVSKNGRIIRDIPFDFMSMELCKVAVQQNGMALKHIENEYLTKDMYEIAVRSNGESLQFVPEQLKTKELCMEALKNNSNALMYFPKKYITYDCCLEAVKHKGYLHNLQKTIPPEFLTPELYNLATRVNGASLRYIPDNMKDYNMCLEAVKNDGMALGDVPEKYKDDNICYTAVAQNGLSIRFVPEHLITHDICMNAVKNYGHTIDYIARNRIDLEMVTEALKTYPSAHLVVDNNMREILVSQKIILSTMPLDTQVYKKQMADMKEIFQSTEPTFKM